MNDVKSSLPEPVPGAVSGTFFASAQRSSAEELSQEIRLMSNNAVIDALMHAASGLLAVLNEHRQVLALNDSMLKLLGVTEPAEVLGLRVGEAVHCIHATEMPGGCGTSACCSTCGQAIAQVISLLENRPVERMCAIAIRKGGGESGLCLRVRAVPFSFSGMRALLLFLQDVSEEQQMAALGRVFLHDVRNTLTGLLGTSELLSRTLNRDDAAGAMAEDVVRLARRVSREVELQRCIVQSALHSYRPAREVCDLAVLLRELKAMCENHSAALGRQFVISPPPPGTKLTTDSTVLLRVLYNMVLNALEATPEGGEVRLWLEGDEPLEFCVWNPTWIGPEIARRVFQRDFSTKGSSGRGLGTYSMKLLSERFLGGEVSFTSSRAAGTCFRVRVSRGRSGAA